jgi:hypothetical protein
MTHKQQQQIRNLVGEAEQALLPLAKPRSMIMSTVSLIFSSFALVLFTFLIVIVLFPFVIIIRCWSSSKSNNCCIQQSKIITNTAMNYITALASIIAHPVLVIPFLCKKRKVLSDADKISELKSTTAFLIPASMILEWESFPQHENVVNQLEVREIKSIQLDIGDDV